MARPNMDHGSTTCSKLSRSVRADSYGLHEAVLPSAPRHREAEGNQAATQAAGKAKDHGEIRQPSAQHLDSWEEPLRAQVPRCL